MLYGGVKIYPYYDQHFYGSFKDIITRIEMNLYYDYNLLIGF
jgi:hypothetical protein